MRKTISMICAAMLACICANAQNAVTVSGTVYDENGLALPGAGVTLEGTTTGTVTDNDGKYSISVKNSARLTFSFIGYNPQTVSVAGRKTIDITLQPNTNLLDEIVVIGYGTMKKSDLTGAISSVSAKAIEGYKTSTVMEALGGQIAGVNITSSDGTPGAGYDIKIRGVGTVNGDSSPLYIVDGFEVSSIDYLANQDIQDIQVLKDASASAIYGSRAANGVVLVTTKSGKTGHTEVSYNGSASYRTLSKKLEVLDPYEYVKLQMELNPTRYSGRYYNVGDDAAGVPFRYQSQEDYLGVEGLDWQDEAFRPTWSQNHDVSVTGGTKETSYTGSFSHFDEDGIFVNSGFRKNSARLKLRQNIYKWLVLDASVNYTSSVKTGQGTGGSVLSNVLNYRPTGGLYTSDYQLRFNAVDPILDQLGMSNSNYYNPILNSENVDQKTATDQWIANGSLTVKFNKHLSFKSSASYSNSFTRRDVFYHEGSSQADRGSGPYGNSRTTKGLKWSNSNVLTYDNTLHKKHRVTATLGHETIYESTSYLYGEAKDFPLDDLGIDNLGMGATPSEVSTSLTDKRRLSFFGRGFYSYDNRYMVTATLRADASTVFSASNKWGFFPSFAGAWTISNEAWMKDISWISNLKLRAGWGTVGNDRISSYLSLDLYTPSKYGIGSSQVTVLTPAQLANKNLRWEGATTTNVGIDASFFKERLNITADAFVKDSKDLLLAQNLALATGFSSQWQNVGKIRNKGLELTVNSVNVSKKNFYWSTDFNISFIRNTLESLADGNDYMLSRSGFNSNFTSYDYIAKVGESLGNMYGYVFDGVYQTSDFNVLPDGTMQLKKGIPDISAHAGETVQPGFVKYKDLDGDGIITTEDRTIIGNGNPDWYGGLTNTFSLYGIDLSFMLQFTVGNDVYNAHRMYSTQSRLEMMNNLVEVKDRWTSENASNKVPSAKGYVAYDVYSRFIEDGSFIRLKNLTLGYTLPERLTRKAFLQKVRVYTTMQNLFCLTRYSGYDPEVNMLSSNLMPGFDYGAYPKTKVFTFGMELKF